MSIFDVSPFFCSSGRNSARLDLLTAVMVESKMYTENNSPHDSLSPLDDGSMYDFKNEEAKRFSFEGFPDEEAVSRQSQQLQEPVDLTFPQPCMQSSSHAASAATLAASTTEQQEEASSPRSNPTLIIRTHHPSNLTLFKTNGFTTIPLPQLRQCIHDSRPAHSPEATRIQIPRPKAELLPKTPDTPSPFFFVTKMGNKPSSLAGSPAPDDDGDASVRSVVRKPLPLLRKSSTNLLKRIVSQTPLPQDLTGVVVQVQQRVSPVSPISVDGVNDEDSALNNQSRDIPPQQSESIVTVTGEYAIQSFSTSTLVHDSKIDLRSEDNAETETPRKANKFDQKPLEKHTLPRDLALSPTIPAPSPLPEDSPHKYGLKDRTDTPDMPEPEEINVVKARRKSSGLDIFNEAKSLQSASSFLNGLSTSRRRAEFAAETSHPNNTKHDTARPYPPHRPKSQPKPKLKPAHSTDRIRIQGHNFKPSGFAYARPLTLTQLKCYRNHARLIPSRNKKAAVECAVCHIDDEGEHWSCSWCALRMCGFCRREFAERGLVALRERVRMAEMGGQGSESSEGSVV